MTDEPNMSIGDDGDAPLYPLLGFTAAIVGGAVALRLDFATCQDEYRAGEGESEQFVMTPDAAIDIGRALLERGELAKGSDRLV